MANETIKTEMTDKVVFLIRKMRGNHFEPNMSYKKIKAALEVKGMSYSENGCEYAGRGITHKDLENDTRNPEGWTPYPLAHTPSTLRRMENRQKLAAQRAVKATKRVAGKEVKKAVVLKDAQGKLTDAGIAKAKELFAADTQAKEIAFQLQINVSNVYRLQKKLALQS